MEKCTNKLGQKLKELRKAHSYTQDDLAAALGVVRQTYSNYETGKRKPDSDALYKLAGLYGISIDDLLHLTVDIDRNIYYDAPCPTSSSKEIDEYISFINAPENQKKFQTLNNTEKELLYFFQKLLSKDQKELIEIAKIKAKNAE